MYSGTPPYCTPQSYLEVQAGPEDDTRAVGAIMYEMFTGAGIQVELREQLDNLEPWQEEAVDRRCRQVDGVPEDEESYFPESDLKLAAAEAEGFVGIKEVLPSNHLPPYSVQYTRCHACMLPLHSMSLRSTPGFIWPFACALY